MAIKRYKPTSAGRRDMTGIIYRDVITTNKPHKKLTKGKKKFAGRNNQGTITVPHQGGGHKRKFRRIDFLMFDKTGIPAKVETVEYDPNRSAFICLVCYADGERRYVLAPKGVKVGDHLLASNEAPLTPGNRLQLKNIPVGTYIFNVELKPQGGAKLARSAGSYIQVAAQNEGKTNLKMPSSEIRQVQDTCWATIGEVSNTDHKLVKLGKAGRSRWMNRRPNVRGSAMNPVDHPHGGGEGKQGIGLRRGPKTKQGKLAYGVKTRKKKKYSRNSIVSRRKTKRGGK